MSDDNIIQFKPKDKSSEPQSENKEAEVKDFNQFDNLNHAVERIAGKKYVFCFFREEDGLPCIVPSEEITTMEMVYLSELMKMVATGGLGVI